MTIQKYNKRKSRFGLKNTMDIMIDYHQYTKLINHFKSTVGWLPNILFFQTCWKGILEDNDRRTLEKSYAFDFFGPFCKINKIFPQTIFVVMHHYQKFWVLQLSHATKIQLHATHASVNFCNCIRQVAWDSMYATCIYSVSIHVHTYIPIQCSCTLCVTFLATTYN